jgi:head-tail adaptor
VTIAAGKLRERVAIQQKNLVDNGRGGRARPADGPEWVNLDENVPAEIIPLRGDEALNQAVLRAVQIYKVTIRARPDVLPSNRLLWGTVPLNIKALALSVDGRELIMTCESGSPG